MIHRVASHWAMANDTFWRRTPLTLSNITTNHPRAGMTRTSMINLFNYCWCHLFISMISSNVELTKVYLSSSKVLIKIVKFKSIIVPFNLWYICYSRITDFYHVRVCGHETRTAKLEQYIQQKCLQLKNWYGKNIFHKEWYTSHNYITKI